MTYQTEMQKTQQNAFQELYEISVGNQTVYYTSGKETVVFNSHTYLPRPIKRGSLTNGTKLQSVRLSITAPIDSTMSRYIANAPAETIRVRIIRCFLTTGKENLLIFDGDVVDATFKDNVCTIECEANTELYRNKIPKIIYQSFCNHMLFDSNCGLLEDSYKIQAILASVSGITLVSASFATKPDGYFQGGHAKLEYDYRLITYHAGSTIHVHVPFDSRCMVGVTVSAWPGCDKSPEVCIAKYNNFSHYLGFPYIPQSNPTIWGV